MTTLIKLSKDYDYLLYDLIVEKLEPYSISHESLPYFEKPTSESYVISQHLVELKESYSSKIYFRSYQFTILSNQQQCTVKLTINSTVIEKVIK